MTYACFKSTYHTTWLACLYSTPKYVCYFSYSITLMTKIKMTCHQLTAHVLVNEPAHWYHIHTKAQTNTGVNKITWRRPIATSQVGLVWSATIIIWGLVNHVNCRFLLSLPLYIFLTFINTNYLQQQIK